jgi:L-seryl-tRNA(Ser) seleniumtransferase
MEHLLTALPAVHQVLQCPRFQAASIGLADPFRTRLVREVVDRHRQELRSGAYAGTDPDEIREAVVDQCVRAARAVLEPFPRRVINGTGVLIHTNLGRAPLGPVLERLDARALAGYSALEWDPETQQRGNRDAHLQRQLQLLTGAEAALVVNNCASALMLALNTLAAGREVLVSRSELVEIGGSFRVPEIMRASGCRLVEVGTTNRTRLRDFEERADPQRSVLLKVHQSNFVQRGFVEQVGVEELVSLGRRLGIPVIEDNGSGLVVDGDHAVLSDEPRVIPSLERGVEVVCCSADKLFGGVQAGILLGSSERIAAMRKNPLYRVLRLDKVRMALMDQVLRYYLADRAGELPLWRMFRTGTDELRARAGRLRLPGPDTRWARCRCVAVEGKLGGGSNPEATFESVGLELRHRDLSAEALKHRFAERAVPIAGYVRQGSFYLDLRTLFPEDYADLQQALDDLAAARPRAE